MSWGTELWDQFDSISYHTNKGIDFLDKYGSFVKERCAIEVEYASKLRRLVKNHQYKKKEESDTQFTYIQAFIMMLQEITDLAGQHELIAENMCSEITNEICKLIKELKEDRKKFLSEGQKLNCNIQNSYIQLDKSKKYYEKAFKEAEKAHENFIRVDADLNLSRAEVEKAKQLSLSKTQLADQYKSEYATNLQRTNDLQRIHFNDSMPKVFDNLQDMEQRRIKKTQNFIFQSAKIQLDVFPIINKCLQGIIKASDLVDAKKDCDYVIERYKSGNEPPEDIPFEDLSSPSTDHNGTSVHSNHSLNYSNSITGKDTMKGTIVYAKLRKRANIFNFFGSNKEEIYADLPPVQRRKRIQEKLNNIQEQFKQETNVRDGLMKMRQAYLENNKLGDPSSLDSQINENSKKLEKLQLELKKYEGFLNEISLKPNTSNSGLNKSSQNGTQKNNQIKNNSLSEESLSRSASDSSVSNPQQSVKNCITNGINNYSKSTLKSNTNSTNNLNNHNYNLNGSYIANSSPSNAGSSNYEQNGHSPEIDIHNVNKNDNMGVNLSNVDYIDGDQHEFEEEEEFEVDLISFGKAKALYAFDPQSEGAIKMSDDDVFDVVELDQGDGWTRVRRSDLEEGFVPTSYLEIELYDK